MKKRTMMIMTAAALTAVAVLAGCGKSEASTSRSVAGQERATPTPPPALSSPVACVKKVRADETIRMSIGLDGRNHADVALCAAALPTDDPVGCVHELQNLSSLFVSRILPDEMLILCSRHASAQRIQCVKDGVANSLWSEDLVNLCKNVD